LLSSPPCLLSILERRWIGLKKLIIFFLPLLFQLKDGDFGYSSIKSLSRMERDLW
jgi:hypothetical protein